MRAMFSSARGGLTAGVYSSAFRIIPFLFISHEVASQRRGFFFSFSPLLKPEKHDSGAEGPDLPVCTDDLVTGAERRNRET